jgi:competence protein ComGC
MVNAGGKARARVSSERGLTFISVVVALVIIGALYYGYLGQYGMKEEITRGGVAQTAGRGIACQMNRQAIERAILTWSMSHPGKQPTLKDLENDGIPINRCPEGGRFKVEGKKVSCSLHSTSG